MGWTFQLVPSHRSARVPPPSNPTAVQTVADVHVTLLTKKDAPPELARDWTDQLVPFHRSATAPPTAMHAVADVHDTEFSSLNDDPPGVVWTDQLVPFQRSAKVAVPVTPPTAMHMVGDGHDTESKPLDPVSVGVVWIAQAVPFQRSANVTCLPAGAAFGKKALPTNVQIVAEMHDTPVSWLNAAPLMVGVGCTNQREPFQRSTSVI